MGAYPEAAIYGETIEVECKFGKLVASVFSNDDDFREIAIDLLRPDGKGVQLCVVGTNENHEGLELFTPEEREEHRDRIHVYLWDGESPDCEKDHYIVPDGEGYYIYTGKQEGDGDASDNQA